MQWVVCIFLLNIIGTVVWRLIDQQPVPLEAWATVCPLGYSAALCYALTIQPQAERPLVNANDGNAPPPPVDEL